MLNRAEQAAFDMAKAKMKDLCEKNGFVMEFRPQKYPIEIIVRMADFADAQQTAMEQEQAPNEDAELRFVFSDSDLYIIPGAKGGLVLSKGLQNKLRS